MTTKSGGNQRNTDQIGLGCTNLLGDPPPSNRSQATPSSPALPGPIRKDRRFVSPLRTSRGTSPLGTNHRTPAPACTLPAWSTPADDWLATGWASTLEYNLDGRGNDPRSVHFLGGTTNTRPTPRTNTPKYLWMAPERRDGAATMLNLIDDGTTLYSY